MIFCYKKSASDAKKAQIWNFTAPKIIVRPVSARTRWGAYGSPHAPLYYRGGRFAAGEGRGRGKRGKGRRRTGGKGEGKVGPQELTEVTPLVLLIYLPHPSPLDRIYVKCQRFCTCIL